MQKFVNFFAENLVSGLTAGNGKKEETQSYFQG